jgi:hypothetical protein
LLYIKFDIANCFYSIVDMATIFKPLLFFQPNFFLDRVSSF